MRESLSSDRRDRGNLATDHKKRYSRYEGGGRRIVRKDGGGKKRKKEDDRGGGGGWGAVFQDATFSSNLGDTEAK